jgi:UbiD family decarboxylase
MTEEIYDLRSFIRRLEQEGELARVRAEVDWKYELGAIARRVFGPPPGPALFFENVKGYDTPVFVGGLHTVRRVAIALGLPPDIDEASLFREYTSRLERPLEPVILEKGPCQENRSSGDEVDILRFPVPWWNEQDGGRYIGTWHQVTTRDPETGWTNVGTYRMMVHEPDLCGIQFSPFQHISQMYLKYRKKGRTMPVAVSIGTDPAAMMVAASPFPANINEWTMAGALRGRPLELVRGLTVDLEVPAYAEIVLEGEIPPDETRPEGPFGEHTGYYGAGIRPLPVVKIKCVTYRNSPIFRGSALGKPVTEQNRVSWLAVVTQIMEVYKSAGFPGVTGVAAPPEGDPEYSAIVAVKKTYASQGLDAGRLLLSSKVGKMMKHVIVVDDDIDIHDLNQVLWAINTRLQAGSEVYITRHESGSRLDPSQPYEAIGFTDKMVIDATWATTPDHPPRPEWGGATHPPLIQTSLETQSLIERRWSEYGIGQLPGR